MRFFIVFIVCAGCAVGSSGPVKVYGHRPPETWDGSSPVPVFDDSNSTLDCFWEEFDEYDSGVLAVYICDGVPFSVQDLVDPPPDQKKQKQ